MNRLRKNNLECPDVTIDDAAMSRYDNVVLFPEKLARVNKMLKTAKLPVGKPRQ